MYWSDSAVRKRIQDSFEPCLLRQCRCWLRRPGQSLAASPRLDRKEGVSLANLTRTAKRWQRNPAMKGNPQSSVDTVEQTRLREARNDVPWKKWGPYLSERQWGTVREDYSQ